MSLPVAAALWSCTAPACAHAVLRPGLQPRSCTSEAVARVSGGVLRKKIHSRIQRSHGCQSLCEVDGRTCDARPQTVPSSAERVIHARPVRLYAEAVPTAGFGDCNFTFYILHVIYSNYTVNVNVTFPYIFYLHNHRLYAKCHETLPPCLPLLACELKAHLTHFKSRPMRLSALRD